MTRGNFLGFTIHEDGIEVDREKADAILQARPPSNKRELQQLIGKVHFLRRFIANLSGKLRPLSPLLKKRDEEPFDWTAEHQDAFDKLKLSLVHPPVMVAPVPGRPLQLYISATEGTVGTFLAQENGKGTEQAIYYLSRVLTEVERRYLPMEKLCLALYTAAMKLRHYMITHVVHVISKVNLVRYMLHRPHLNGRLGRWALALMEYQFIHVPQTAVRGQVLADFLAEHPSIDIESVKVCQQEAACSQVWRLQFDGSATYDRSGAGIVITSPAGHEFYFMVLLEFQCTNNQAEYEGLVQGLRLLQGRGVTSVMYGGGLHANYSTGQWRVPVQGPDPCTILQARAAVALGVRRHLLLPCLSRGQSKGQRPSTNGLGVQGCACRRM